MSFSQVTSDAKRKLILDKYTEPELRHFLLHYNRKKVDNFRLIKSFAAAGFIISIVFSLAIIIAIYIKLLQKETSSISS